MYGRARVWCGRGWSVVGMVCGMELAALLVLTGALLERGGAQPAQADLQHVRAFLASSSQQLRRRYRPLYHLSASYGWLNDPAAFVFFKRKYHLFYQYHPYDGSWGPAAWGHAASSDLVRWAHYPPAVLPRDALDRGGCLAGSAVNHNGHLALFYTGRALRDNVTRSTVGVAVSADAVVFQKYMYNPVVRGAPDGASDFRNPKVWRHRDAWYMLVGASIRERGHLLLYTSPDLYAWRANGTVARSLGDMGRAWESPDAFELDGLCVLLLSARGVRPDGDRFRNLQVAGYVTGQFDCPGARFPDLEISQATFEELDRGHDLYAAKTTRSVDGRRLMVAWLGMWEATFEEAPDGWAGCMTLVRELRMTRGGRLLQAPAREMARLRGEMIENAWYAPGESFATGARSFELLVNATTASYDAEIVLEWQGERQYSVRYWAARGLAGVDRHGSGPDAPRRADWAPAGPLHWRIFVDRSSVEVFCGGGEVTFTSRIYPRGAMLLRVLGHMQLHITQYKIKRSIGFDHKLTKYIRNHVLRE